MRLLKRILELLLPNRCAGCGKIEPLGMCSDCYSKLSFVGKNACPKCGREPQWCWCGKTPEGKENPIPIPTWQQLTAPFYYEDLVRKAIVRYKFRHERYHAEWIAAEMAAKVREQMDLSMVDVIVPVPLSVQRERERGYNQAALLAQALSKELSLPCREELLLKTKDTRIQHTLTRVQRLRNAKDAYHADEKAAGLRILLIDDISTTGATLESCAGELFRAGAEAVVCCTAAVTKWENETYI